MFTWVGWMRGGGVRGSSGETHNNRGKEERTSIMIYNDGWMAYPKLIVGDA